VTLTVVRLNRRRLTMGRMKGGRLRRSVVRFGSITKRADGVRVRVCEVRKVDGGTCVRQSRFMVHVRTVPQPLGEDGKWGMETSPAGRSIIACPGHVARAVDELYAIKYVWPGARVTVGRWVPAHLLGAVTVNGRVR